MRGKNSATLFFHASFRGFSQICIVMVMCLVVIPSLLPADGVTIITHSWNPNIAGEPAWLSAMRDAISEDWLAGEQNFGKITVTGTLGSLTATCDPWNVGLSSSSTGEIIIILDWSSIADHLITHIPAQDVAAVVAPKILESQHGKRPLAELPIHLIGHSRGGGLVCELARLLGEKGVVVDHLTPLDPHPLTSDDPQPGFPFPDVIDTPAKIYENVLFADCYYQEIAYPEGEYLTGAYNREWTSLPGGYHNNTPPYNAYADHRNIYLAYHGTIDYDIPTNNGEAELGFAERNAWFNAYESDGVTSGARTGFYYSRINAKGNRKSLDTPVSGGDRIIDGYNDDPLLGGAGSRESLGWSSAVWPNVITLDVLKDSSPLGYGTHPISIGSSLDLRYTYLDYDSASTVTLYVDVDRNPYNGNNVLIIASRNHSATGSTIAQSTVSFDTSSLSEGTTVCIGAKATDGIRTRYLYAVPV
ncbi:hypothetical protein J7M23_03535, partial [Candidatus Sumerlaeota bacterium]|nr:hypothetical protein [Candidatus Sumerlaeota bacterium]